MICPHCNSKNTGKLFCADCGKTITDLTPPYTNVFQSYIDYGSMREINSPKQEKEICKRENKVMGGYHELRQEAKKNKVYNQEKVTKEIINNTVDRAIKAGLISA